jgi:class 3 adenylate cyclase
MTFDEILEQVITLLKRQGRVSYPALKIRFNLEDDYLEALKAEILYVHPVVDDEGKGLIWTGEPATKPEPESPPQPAQTSEQLTTQEAQPIQAEFPSTEPHTPDAECRQLTVMFIDIVESTSLSSQLDPEDLREVVREYQQVCSEVIQHFDGHVAQLLGDGLLVYFGYPQAHEDDAQRAVRTGLGIIEAIGKLNARLEQAKGIKLAVRLGVHTGLVVVGEMGGEGRQEQLALGEVPNIASRIQGIAEPDSVVIGATTFHLVEGYFTCQDLGEQTLRGVEPPITVYRVFQESAAQSRLDIVTTRGLTPLVGREQEVGLLLERWNQVKDGQGQVVLLSGEGGIGKSRLVQVIKEHVAGESHISLECRSSPYYQNTALYPITDLFQRTLQWQQDDTSEQRLEKLEQTLKQYRLPLEETVPLFATLLSLPIPEDRYPPLNWTPQRQRQKTLEAIVAMLLELAEQQPVLFILEDLHWTDPSTLELLDLLIDQTPTASLLALLTCRPAFQPTWGLRTHLTPISLSRLSRNQSERMAERVAGGKSVPAEVL